MTQIMINVPLERPVSWHQEVAIAAVLLSLYKEQIVTIPAKRKKKAEAVLQTLKCVPPDMNAS